MRPDWNNMRPLDKLDTSTNYTMTPAFFIALNISTCQRGSPEEQSPGTTPTLISRLELIDTPLLRTLDEYFPPGHQLMPI